MRAAPEWLTENYIHGGRAVPEVAVPPLEATCPEQGHIHYSEAGHRPSQSGAPQPQGRSMGEREQQLPAGLLSFSPKEPPLLGARDTSPPGGVGTHLKQLPAGSKYIPRNFCFKNKKICVLLFYKPCLLKCTTSILYLFPTSTISIPEHWLPPRSGPGPPPGVTCPAPAASHADMDTSEAF